MATPKETILITGASSGLGLAFTKHFASLSTHTVIALDKQPFPSSIPQSQNLHFHHLDITSADEVQTLASHYASTPLTLILHCAGIRGLVPSVVAQEEEAGTHDAARTETMEVMDKETMMKTFEINTWGTFNLVRAFLPNLLLSCSGSGSTSTPRPRVVVLSSRMSSIYANAAGGGYAYRSSKAALNAVVGSFTIDVPQVGFLLLHPGRVETGLVAWKEDGAISVEESVGDCLRVLGRMEEEGWKSGRLVDRFGEEIAW